MRMSKTDFAKIDAMPDEEIDFSDIPPLTDAQLASMKPLHDVFPSELRAQDRATVQLDADIFEWFRMHTPDYQTQINRVLRRYVQHRTQRAVHSARS